MVVGWWGGGVVGWWGGGVVSLGSRYGDEMAATGRPDYRTITAIPPHRPLSPKPSTPPSHHPTIPPSHHPTTPPPHHPPTRLSAYPPTLECHAHPLAQRPPEGG